MFKERMNKKEFMVWVRNSLNSFYTGKEFKNLNYYILESAGITLIVNNKTGKMAMARRSKSDAYNEDIGIAIAFARYMHRPIPILIDDEE